MTLGYYISLIQNDSSLSLSLRGKGQTAFRLAQFYGMTYILDLPSCQLCCVVSGRSQTHALDEKVKICMECL